jgi:hypothetical protein
MDQRKKLLSYKRRKGGNQTKRKKTVVNVE